MNKNTDFCFDKIKELQGQDLSRLISLAESATDQKDIFAYAACYKAVTEKLGIMPFDEQLMAAYALDGGKIIQMATGEGKTLSAVFAAYLNVLEGRKIHILTFNDYLAKRDYNWMKPVYDSLGVNIAYLSEKSTKNERKKAYNSDVVYLTAKESGFDFLRDFVANDKNDIVCNRYEMAIVDEADSLLIDEARIPLVITGNTDITVDNDMAQIMEFVKTFSESDYDTSNETDEAYLTDDGAAKLEEKFNIENIYDTENQELLTKVSNCLKACFMLNEDEDYIVKDNEIKIVDAFTGRVANDRHYPGLLQAAVELKHGIKPTTRGTVMGSVPLQFFMRKYTKLAGMTGTAVSSKEEFYQLYDLSIEEIPTHLPCRRVDKPVSLYYNRESKYTAIIKAITDAHEKGQPVLLGTAGIDESEWCANELEKHGIKAVVLNAKNDEMESEIINNAGAYSAVTISTRMAGRGVDIKLGGADCRDKEKVEAAGGLLVICTELSASSRINQQLSGRAGRQGDIGESRIFAALDDDIMIKYNLKSLIPFFRYPKKTTEMITDKSVLKEVMRIQRISEGNDQDERERLLKFTMISEKHRESVFTLRFQYLLGEKEPDIWQKNNAEEYDAACYKYGKDNVDQMEKKLILSVLITVWSEYLEYSSYMRQSVHLTRIAGKNPAEEFNIACEDYFNGMDENVNELMATHLKNILSADSISDYKVPCYTDIWTYLVDESGDELLKKPFLVKALDDTDDKEKNNNNSLSKWIFKHK